MDSSQFQLKDPHRIEGTKKRLRSCSSHINENKFEEFKETNSILAMLPCRVARNIRTESNVTSMMFHPLRHTILLVGFGSGEIIVWDLHKGRKLTSNSFEIYDGKRRSLHFQWSLARDSLVSINRVVWSPNGRIIGVAYNKNLIHLFAYQESDKLDLILEIEAHLGSVNDIAFCEVNKKPAVVTCGDDNVIKVWGCDGNHLYSFEGHNAPGVCVCPRQVEDTQVLLSTAVGEKIKAWPSVINSPIECVEYDAPGCGCTVVLCSTDGTRLFSCGSNKDGEFFLVEWDEKERDKKRTYEGFRNKSIGVVHFDTSNQILAAGEDNHIIFWDMDKTNHITRTRAEGALPLFPRLKFNKEGNLLAVTTKQNGFKILANDKGFGSLMPDPCSVVSLRESLDHADQVSWLLYIASGCGVIALYSNGVHDKWFWSEDRAMMANAAEHPQVYMPRCMLNDVLGINLKKALPCMTLSKCKKYGLSATGGKISLWLMEDMTLLKSIKCNSSAPTFLAFHPGDPIYLLVGMEDSTILVYHTEKGLLETLDGGHRHPITGLAFSEKLNMLVSSSAGDELCQWEMMPLDLLDLPLFLRLQTVSVNYKHDFMKLPNGVTRVQFHMNETHLLVYHESQLAIYDALKMECIQWLPQDRLSASISFAAYSCDSALVYASFIDGYINVFESDTLRLLHCIPPSAYASQSMSNSQNPRAYPVVIATHPEKPNQLAVGFSNGIVKVIEPFDESGWPRLAAAAVANIER